MATNPNPPVPTDAERAAQTQAAIEARAAAIREGPVPLHARSREAFKQQILPSESVDPQKRALMSDAIDSIFHGLGELMKQGHSYVLTKHDPATVRPIEWPKMMYDSSGKGWTFDSQAHLDEVATANPSMVWYDHPTDRPDEAAQAAAAKKKADAKAKAEADKAKADADAKASASAKK